MKTKISSLLIFLGFILLSTSKVSAQAGCFSNTISGPTHTEIQSSNPILDFTLEPSINPCNTSAGGNLSGVGINQSNPQYILDIVGTYVGDGVNVGNPATLPNPNAVGYSIGSQMVLWNNGITDDIFAGVGAGNAGVTGQYNTYVGNDAGFSTVSGNSNSFIGAWSTEQV